MKRIIISGAIGYWGVEAYDIRQQLNDANGEDIEVDISSEGGSDFEGVEIYNLFSDYKRENPNAGMICNIKSLAASMGSYIAINNIFDLVTTEDNASMMIHNPLNMVVGDFQVMRKNADFLERLAKMMSRAYSDRSGKSIDEIQKMMNEETWLFGSEIVESGFADEVIKTESTKDKDEALAFATTQFESTKLKMQRTEMSEKEFDKAVAMMGLKPAQQPIAQKPKQEEIIMNEKELQAKYPDIHKAVMQKGIEQEKARVSSLLEMKAKKDFDGIGAIHERIESGIKNGETMTAVEIGVMAELKKDGVQATLESAPDIDLGSDPSMSGEPAKEKFDNDRW